MCFLVSHKILAKYDIFIQLFYVKTIIYWHIQRTGYSKSFGCSLKAWFKRKKYLSLASNLFRHGCHWKEEEPRGLMNFPSSPCGFQWWKRGSEIQDGGKTELSRTFYFKSTTFAFELTIMASPRKMWVAVNYRQIKNDFTPINYMYIRTHFIGSLQLIYLYK